MRRTLALLLTLAFSITSALAADPSKLGTYTTTFTDPSPLTTKPELLRRFGRDDVPTYDLTKETFLVHVPVTYTSDTPHGIFLFLNYEDSDTLPPSIAPLLSRHRLIYVMNTRQGQSDPTIAALSADAVHNLSKHYNIDPSRIYVAGLAGTITTGIAYSDLFTGAFVWSRLQYLRPLTNPENRDIYPVSLPKLQGPTLGQAKLRPWVIATRPDLDDATAAYHALVLKAFRQDGFRAVRSARYTKEDFHYPDLTTDWVEEALAFFRDNAATTQPATPSSGHSVTAAPLPRPRPVSKPTISEPQRLLTLAKFFIRNKAYPSAKERLETIIKDYPDHPAATEAKELLQTLSAK